MPVADILAHGERARRSTTLLASLFVALVIIPVLATLFVRPKSVKPHRETWGQRLYTPAIRWSLGHRARTLVIAGALLAGLIALLPVLGTSFLSNSNEKMLLVPLSLPSGSERTTTLAQAEQIEKILARQADVDQYITVIGSPHMLALFFKGGDAGLR